MMKRKVMAHLKPMEKNDFHHWLVLFFTGLISAHVIAQEIPPANGPVISKPEIVIAADASVKPANETGNKAEVKAEPKGEIKAEVKAEPKGEIKAEVKAEPKGEIKAEVKAEPKTEAEAAPHIISPLNDAAPLVREYEVPLLKNDMVFYKPINRWDFWFDNRLDKPICGKAYLALYISCSPTLLPERSSITVFLNDNPIASRRLEGTITPNAWVVEMPLRYLRTGMNQLKLMCRHRSQVGTKLEDIDNPANWVRLESNSRLYLSRRVDGCYNLDLFPYPFIDPTSPFDPVQAAFVLPAEFTDYEVEAMMQIASEWGRRYPALPLRPAVHTGKNPFTMAHRVIIDGNVDMERGTADLSTENDQGSVTLSVKGADREGLLKATTVLTNPEAIRQFHREQLEFTEIIPKSPITAGTRYGNSTFRDIGSSDIVFSGAFYQEASIVVTRPPLAKLGKRSYLDIHLRHSSSMQLEHASIRVFINSRPLANIPLSSANIVDGRFKINIPIDMLMEPVWVIGFECYNAADTDCDKLLERVAWTVVEADSEVVLDTGKVNGHPFLKRFPYFRNNDGMLTEPVTVWTPNRRPTDAQLTTLATLAVRAGQVNGAALSWQLVHDDLATLRPSGNLIVLGGSDDVADILPLQKTLSIMPQPQKHYKIDPSLLLFEANVRDNLILQAGISPWDARNLIYTVISDNDAFFKLLNSTLTDPDRNEQLIGHVSLVRPDGKILSFQPVTNEEREDLLGRELNDYTPAMMLLAGIFILILIWLLWRLFGIFFKKPVAKPEK